MGFNYSEGVTPSHGVIDPPQLDRGRASLRDSECEFFSNSDWAKGERMNWCCGGSVTKQRVPLSHVSKFTGRAWMNAPPTALLPCRSYVFPHLSLSPSVSWNITAGQKTPSLMSAGLHNENKWAGSKHAGGVATPQYSACRLSWKMKMDYVAKSSQQCCAVFHLSKAELWSRSCTFISIEKTLFIYVLLIFTLIE